jgi:hypothetical protein
MSDSAPITQATANTPISGDAQPAASVAPAATSAPASAPAGDATTAATATTSQQATEGQPAATPAAANTEGDTGTKGDQPSSAPEKYEFKAPEGTSLDEAVIAEYSTVAKELGLSQEAAQKVIDKLAPKLAERTAAAQVEAFNAFKDGLEAQTRADKELGGDKLNENLAVAKKALNAFGTPELRKLLDDTGLANHPEVIRVLFKAGKSISEDRFVPGGTQPTKGERDAASALYPKQKTA